MTDPEFLPRCDGTIALRAPSPDDASVLEAGRDAEFFRWLGAEADMEPPLACIVVDEEVAGWIDYDVARSWLEEGEVNIGYFVLAKYRRRGCATRALELLLGYLRDETDYKVATLLIDTRNEWSLAVARRARFSQVDDIGGGAFYFKRDVRESRTLGDAAEQPA
ncbi:MAG TPA: GNAT family N-acetyltransferase [Acidimicrobiales bacterium]